MIPTLPIFFVYIFRLARPVRLSFLFILYRAFDFIFFDFILVNEIEITVALSEIKSCPIFHSFIINNCLVDKLHCKVSDGRIKLFRETKSEIKAWFLGRKFNVFLWETNQRVLSYIGIVAADHFSEPHNGIS